jgi:hypothetical protein
MSLLVCELAQARSSFKSPPKRRTASDRRLLHDDEARSLKVLHKPLGDDLRHDLVGVVDSLAALEEEGECERGCAMSLGSAGRRTFGRVGHCARIADRLEHNKNWSRDGAIQPKQQETAMTHFNSTEILEFLFKNDGLISFEKAVPAGRLKRDFIPLCARDGRAMGLTTPAGYSTTHIELPRVMFDDLIAAALIEQDRPEDSDGRILFRLTVDGRTRAAT